MNLKSLYYILSTLLLMVCTMGFWSCSKDNVEEVDNVAKNVCFKVEVRTGGYGAGTRAAGPSKDDGTLADDENEKAVYNATLFIYQNDKGINGAADTPILYSVYLPNFSKDTEHSSTYGGVYTSSVVDTRYSIPAGDYHVIIVCNMGRLTANTLGDVQQMTTANATFGTLQQPETCSTFAMSSSDDKSIHIDGHSNMANVKDGVLVEMKADVQRLAARIDFSAGGKGKWVSEVVNTAEGNKKLEGYKYTIGTEPNADYFYLTGVTPINLLNSEEYVLKRVTEDKTFNTIQYLGKELLSSDGNAANYVVDPYILQKSPSSNALGLSYTNRYEEMKSSFAACNSGLNKITQITNGAPNCYTDATDNLTYKRLVYAKENTITIGANKKAYVTGLLFTGYYKKAGEAAVQKTYEYFIRHTDPYNSNSDALAMKYGIVRNHVYQVRINSVSSMGLILIQVRDWIPIVAPDIDL